MSLLEFEQVSKHYEHGPQRLDVLRNISLELDGGELVAIWGLRCSGRSTLLRLAAGIDAPSSGTVRFAGRALTTDENPLGRGVAYCRRGSRTARGQVVLDELLASQLARGVTTSVARAHAREVLDRVGIEHCSKAKSFELTGADAARVMIAEALVSRPSLLLVDEPTKYVDLLERDGILKLLRSIASDGVTILMSVDESTGLYGASRALSLSNGEIHGIAVPRLAPVVRLPQRAIA